MPQKENIRIVQLIDSLEAGGAERMAVNYANGLKKVVAFSGLVVTRAEGDLKHQLNNSNSYLFLKREKTIDIKALLRFKAYLKMNNVGLIHAHSTSVFFAFLIKILLPKIKIIWHDHYGNSELLHFRKKSVLQFISLFLFGIISVNEHLKKWAIEKLYSKKVIYLPNFTNKKAEDAFLETKLKGITGKRILCLANLRPQKNHQLLLEIAGELAKTHPDWTFHLVGKDFEDTYSNEIKAAIATRGLRNNVFLYGSKNDIFSIISHVDIGVLTSLSEGLPVALLEYGIGKLPVVCTDVGEISSIIQTNNNGILINNQDKVSFLKALIYLIDYPQVRSNFGQELYKEIYKTYAEEPVLEHYISWINER